MKTILVKVEDSLVHHETPKQCKKHSPLVEEMTGILPKDFDFEAERLANLE